MVVNMQDVQSRFPNLNWARISRRTAFASAFPFEYLHRPVQMPGFVVQGRVAVKLDQRSPSNSLVRVRFLFPVAACLRFAVAVSFRLLQLTFHSFPLADKKSFRSSLCGCGGAPDGL